MWDPVRSACSSRTLGASEAAVFFRITLPLAWRGILAGVLFGVAAIIGVGLILVQWLKAIGAHVIGRNQGTIGICLIGGFGSAETDRAEQHFSARQLITLRQQIQGISMRTQISIISGHNQYAAKACPGFHVPTWFKGA